MCPHCRGDWRQSFGNYVEKGDIYYDISKLLGGILINYKKVKMNKFNIICHSIGFTSITLLSDKNSFKYFLISHQPVESGVPKLIKRTPVLPNFMFG